MRVDTPVVFCYGAANRDALKFPDPDRYDIDRRPGSHLGFGGGKHYCIGSAIAVLVTEVAMVEFLRRIPDFALTARDFDWTPSTNFRSPMALPFAVAA
jgi:hypothetical protein